MGVALSGNASSLFSHCLDHVKSRWFIFVLTLVVIFRRWWFPPQKPGLWKSGWCHGRAGPEVLGFSRSRGGRAAAAEGTFQNDKGLRSQVSWPTIGAKMSRSTSPGLMAGSVATQYELQLSGNGSCRARSLWFYRSAVFLCLSQLVSPGWTEPQCPDDPRYVCSTRVRLFQYISQNDCMSIHQIISGNTCLCYNRCQIHVRLFVSICYLTNISTYVRYYLSTLMLCTYSRHPHCASCPRNGGLGEGREKRHHRGGRCGLNAVCWAAHLGKPGDPEENAGDGLETWRCQGWTPGGKRNTYGGYISRSSIIFRMIKDQESGPLF